MASRYSSARSMPSFAQAMPNVKPKTLLFESIRYYAFLVKRNPRKKGIRRRAQILVSYKNKIHG
jgi:hypothetical protein